MIGDYPKSPFRAGAVEEVESPYQSSFVLMPSLQDRERAKRAHELAMHAAYKACGMAQDIADAYNTAYKIVMEANHG